MKNFLAWSCVLAAFIAVHVGSAPSCPLNVLWGDEDNLTTYNFCDGKTQGKLVCPEGTGFISNAELQGCVPFEKWNCGNAKSGSKLTCQNGTNNVTPWASENPMLYYFCDNGIRFDSPCPNNKAFYKDDINLGCYDIKTYRAKTNCTDFLPLATK